MLFTRVICVQSNEGYLMFYDHKKKDEDNKKTSSSQVFTETLNAYVNALNEAASQYNESRKKAEEHIQRGARITKHRINL
ncbi:hypothetical protein TOL5_29970 [Acinetobacter sp. Tol 5]|nr:hypothetical protein TOL5_29970 [Acinetobacter sp. Tol 5]